MKPPKIELQALYQTGLSAQKIGLRYGVRKISVLRWMRSYEIPRREQRGAATSRASARPDRATLHKLLYGEFKTLQEIGDQYEASKQAVRQWLKRFGIPYRNLSNTRWKGRREELNDSLLKHLYLDCDYSLMAIGRMFEMGPDAIKGLCKEFGIPIKLAGWNRRRFVGTDGHILRSLYEKRVCDWLSDHSIPHGCEPRILKTSYRADFLARDCYIEVWGVTGNVTYSERKQRKLELYKENNLRLIDISHSRFSRNTWRQPLAVLLPASALRS